MKHIKLFESFIAEGNIDGYFIAQIAGGLHTGDLDKNMKNLEDWNDEYDIFPDWDEDDDDNINGWAKKKFKSAETSPSDFSKNFRGVWFEGDNKEKAEKEIEKLKSEGFSYYGLLRDSMGYGGMDIVVVTKKPVKTKDFSMDKPIDEMLEDGHLKNLWGF
jgi:hypothetical protein